MFQRDEMCPPDNTEWREIAPSPWSLWAVCATFRWAQEMSLSGGWALRRDGLRLRRGRIRLYSPDRRTRPSAIIC